MIARRPAARRPRDPRPLDPPSPTALGLRLAGHASRAGPGAVTWLGRVPARLARLGATLGLLYGAMLVVFAAWVPFPVACAVGKGVDLALPLAGGMAGGLLAFLGAPFAAMADGAVTTRGAALALLALLALPGTLFGWAWALLALHDRWRGWRVLGPWRTPASAVLAAPLVVPMGEAAMRMGEHGDPALYVQAAAFGWGPCPASGEWGTGLG